MQAQTLIREGKVKEALAELFQSVRDNPANLDYRIYLFQLLAVDGQYDRALTQLNVTGEMDPKTLMMVQTYREVIQCEVLRSQVFAGVKTPLIFGDPEAWVAPVLESLKQAAAGEHEKAQQLRESAYELIPTISGNINGDAFEWMADADSRIGPFVEAIVNGKYFWIPTTCIKDIHFHEPEDLRDLVWLPTEFTWANEGKAVGFVPVRYIDNASESKPELQLARLTDWQQAADNIYYGLGQRMFATDAGDYSLLDIRDIHFDVAVVADDAEEAAMAIEE